MNSVFRRCVSMLMAGAMVLCVGHGESAAQVRATAPVRVEATPAWVIAKATPPDERATTAFSTALGLNALLEAWQSEVRGSGQETQHYERQVWHVSKSSALQALGSLRTSFVADHQRLLVHEAAILRGGDRIDVTRALQFNVTPIANRSPELQVTGRVLAVAQVPDLRVGDRLVWAYSIEGQNPVFGDQFALNLPWASAAMTLLRTVRVLVPKSQELQFKWMLPQGMAEPKVQETADANWRDTRWSAFGLAAPASAEWMPDGYNSRGLLTLSTYADWQDVRRWANGLFAVPNNAAVVALANQLRTDSEPLSSSVAKAVRFVQDDIRYHAITVGENTHRPRSPEQTLSQRFGDCKDKSLLLVALLRRWGIDANVVLVSAYERSRAALYVAGPMAFDHAIVQFSLDGQTHVVDATKTSNGIRFDKQGQDYNGSVGLVMGARTTNNLDPLGSGKPLLASQTRLNVKASGLEQSAELELETRFHGVAAERMRRSFGDLGVAERDAKLLSVARSTWRDAVSAAGFPKVTDDRANNTFFIAERYSVPKLMTKESNQNAWFAGLLMPRIFAVMPMQDVPKDRSHPLALPEAQTRHTFQTRVEFPTNIQGAEDSASDDVVDSHFLWKSQRSFRGNVLEFSGEFAVLSEAVAVRDLAAFRTKMESFKNKPMDTVFLTQRNITNEAMVGKSLKERLLAEAQDTVRLATEVIAAGKLTGSDLANSLSERAAAYTTLDKPQLATADVQQALRLDARSEVALSTRADMQRRDGKFSAAEADYSRAISLSKEPSFWYFERGITRFLAGQFAQAKADFEQSRKSSSDGRNAGLALIWEAIANKRLGQSIGNLPELKGQWPDPVARLIWGKASVAQTLAAAKGASDDETQSNLCEGHFYIGLWQAANGDSAAARQSFQRSIDTGVVNFIEFGLARVLLSMP